MEAVLRKLRSMWKTEKSFDIQDLGFNMVLVLFDEEYDLDHILMCGPRSFDKYLLGLYKLEKNEAVKHARFDRAYKLEKNEAVKHARFDRASFWVQMHDLPIQHMNRENAEAIGNSVGLVAQVDTSSTATVVAGIYMCA